MAAAPTYNAIATNTLTSAQTAVQFNSISGAYTDLVLHCSLKANTTGNSTILLTMNQDNSSLYSGAQIYFNTSTYASNKNVNETYIAIARGTGMPAAIGDTSTLVLNFNNYSNTSMFKSIIGRYDSPSSGPEIEVGLYRSLSAVSTIRLQVDTNGFAIGSTFTLYGIEAA